MAVHLRLIGAWAEAAARRAELEQLPEGRVFARVPGCAGAVATGANGEEALKQLCEVLEDWAALGLRVGDEVPLIDGIDLNTHGVRQTVR